MTPEKRKKQDKSQGKKTKKGSYEFCHCCLSKISNYYFQLFEGKQ